IESFPVRRRPDRRQRRQDLIRLRGNWRRWRRRRGGARRGRGLSGGQGGQRVVLVLQERGLAARHRTDGEVLLARFIRGQRAGANGLMRRLRPRRHVLPNQIVNVKLRAVGRNQLEPVIQRDLERRNQTLQTLRVVLLHQGFDV